MKKLINRHWKYVKSIISNKTETFTTIINKFFLKDIIKQNPLRSSVVILSVSLLLIFAYVFWFVPPNKESVLNHLDNISFLVETEYGSGSGTLFSRRDENGDLVHFIWTAGHVIQRAENPPDNKFNITFKNIVVSKINTTDGIKEDKITYKAKVIKFSGFEGGDDLALLELVDKNIFYDTVEFNLQMVNVGTFLYHIGCLFGKDGYNSVSEGILSSIGRIIDGKVFDQTTTTVFPGSSGGGIFDIKGKYIGMVTMMRQANVNYIVPMRRMIKWASENHVEWALSNMYPLPSKYIRNNLEKDSELDSDVEKLSFVLNKRTFELKDKIIEQEKLIQDLKRLLEDTRKRLNLTNSLPQVKTNSLTDDEEEDEEDLE